MDLQLEGRSCLITGASTGIGAGIARAMAAEGARIAITARREGLLAVLAAEITRSSGGEVAVIEADITAPGGPAAIASAAREHLGGVDILVNAAGGSRPLKLDAGEAEWNEALDLNFHSARRLAHELLPAMVANRWGRIVNITGSMEPRTMNAAVAAKAALHMWAKGLSCDVAASGVTVNCVAPGRINSEQILQKLHPTEQARREFIARNIPIGHFGEPQDMANLVAFLASPRAAYITGAVIPVDGGMHYFGH